MIASGALKHELELRRNVESVNADGDVVFTPQRIATLRAYIKPLRGEEHLQAEQVHAGHTIEITVRYYADITTSDHLCWVARDRTFEIGTIANVDELDRDLVLMCREVVAGAR